MKDFETLARLEESKAFMLLCCEEAVHVMNGREFELFLGKLLALTDAYTDVTVTQASVDRGADILATDKTGRRVCIQVKHTKSKPGVGSVQEACTGMLYYGAEVAAVITTAPGFTRETYNVAAKVGCQLADIRYVTELMDRHVEATLQAVRDNPRLARPIIEQILREDDEWEE